MAIKILSGMKIKLAETTVECPNNKAGSKPMRKSCPPNFDCRCLRACLDIGVKPSIIGLITRGINNITAAV